MSRTTRPSEIRGRKVGVTLEAAGVGLEEDSALPKGILTSSLPGVFSTTRFMATPSVAWRTFPLPGRTAEEKHVDKNKDYGLE